MQTQNAIFRALEGSWAVVKVSRDSSKKEIQLQGIASFIKSDLEIAEVYNYTEVLAITKPVSQTQHGTVSKQLLFKFCDHKIAVRRVLDGSNSEKLYEVALKEESNECNTTFSHTGSQYSMRFRFPTKQTPNEFSIRCTAIGAENFNSITEFSKISKPRSTQIPYPALSA